MQTTLSSKGQIVIPSQIRKSHGWRSGAIFTIIDEGNTLIIKLVRSRKTVSIEDVIGCAGYKGERKSLAEMDAGILEEARKQALSWSR